MGAVIRHARKSDRDAFLGLWAAMLVENHGIGGEILPTQRNIDYFGRVFDDYQAERFQGVCVVAEGEDTSLYGCLLWGDSGPSSLETRFGRIAMGWGTYVRPECRLLGISTELRGPGSLARVALREMGFDSVLGSAVETNEAGIRSGLDRCGFRLHGIVAVLDLREAA
jgi:hypothetical protein